MSTPDDPAVAVDPEGAEGEPFIGEGRLSMAWLRHDPPPWLPKAVLVVALVGFGAFTAWWIAVRLSDLLVLLLAALFVGFALEPLVNRLARRGVRRGAATLLVYLAIFLAFAILAAAFGSLLVDQITQIAKSLPDLFLSFATWLKEQFNVNLTEEVEKLTGSLTTFGGTIASQALSFGATILSSIFSLFTIALFAFYITAQGPQLRRWVCSLLSPSSQREVLRAWDIAVTKTGGYIYSRVLLALASTVVTTLFLVLIKVPNALTLGIFVGLISQFIPTVGTYIAGALPILVALTISPWKALLVLAFIVGYQQFENYVLTPPLSSRTMELHPAVAFGSVIAGATLIGPLGALIALPATATIQSFLSTYVRRQELVDSPMLPSEPLRTLPEPDLGVSGDPTAT